MADNPLERQITGDELFKLISYWDGNTGDTLVNPMGPQWRSEIARMVSLLKDSPAYEQLQADPSKQVPLMSLLTQDQMSALNEKGPQAIFFDAKSPINAFLSLASWEQLPEAPGAPKDLNEAIQFLQTMPTKDYVIRILGEATRMDMNYKLITDLNPADTALYSELVRLVNDPNIAGNQILPVQKFMPILGKFTSVAYNPDTAESLIPFDIRKSLNAATLLAGINAAVASYQYSKKLAKARQEKEEQDKFKANEEEMKKAQQAADEVQQKNAKLLADAQEEQKAILAAQIAEQERTAKEGGQIAPEQLASSAKAQSDGEVDKISAEEMQQQTDYVRALYEGYRNAKTADEQQEFLEQAREFGVEELLTNRDEFDRRMQAAEQLIAEARAKEQEQANREAPAISPAPAATPSSTSSLSASDQITPSQGSSTTAPAAGLQPATQSSSPVSSTPPPMGSAPNFNQPLPPLPGANQPPSALTVQPGSQTDTDGPGDKRSNWFIGLSANPQSPLSTSEAATEETPKGSDPQSPISAPARSAGVSSEQQAKTIQGKEKIATKDEAKAAETTKTADSDKDRSIREDSALSDAKSSVESKDNKVEPKGVDKQPDLETAYKPSAPFQGVRGKFRGGELNTVLDELQALSAQKEPGFFGRIQRRITGENYQQAADFARKEYLAGRFKQLTGEDYDSKLNDAYRSRFLREGRTVDPSVSISTSANPKELNRTTEKPTPATAKASDENLDKEQDKQTELKDASPSAGTAATKEIKSSKDKDSKVSEPKRAEAKATTKETASTSLDQDPAYMKAKEDVWREAYEQTHPGAQFVRDSKSNILYIANTDGSASSTAVTSFDSNNAALLTQKAMQLYLERVKNVDSEAQEQEEGIETAPVASLGLGEGEGGSSRLAEELKDVLDTDTSRQPEATRTTATPVSTAAEATTTTTSQDLSALHEAEQKLSEVAAQAQAAQAAAAPVRRNETTVASVKARNQKRVDDAYRNFMSGALTGNKEQRKEAIRSLLRSENLYVDTGKDFREAKEYIARHAAKYVDKAVTGSKAVVRRVGKGAGTLAVAVVKSPYTLAKKAYERSKAQKRFLGYAVDLVVDTVKDVASNVKEIYTDAKTFVKDTRIFKSSIAGLSKIKTGVYTAAESAAASVGSKYASAMKLLEGVRYHAGQAYRIAANVGTTVMKGYEIGKSFVAGIARGAVGSGLVYIGLGGLAGPLSPLALAAVAGTGIATTGFSTVNNLFNSTSRYSPLAHLSHNRFFDANGRLLDLSGTAATRLAPGVEGPMISSQDYLARSMQIQGNLYGGWQRIFRAGNAGMLGAAIGTAVGGLLGGPALGAVLGFGVFAGGRALVDTIYGSAASKFILNQELLGSQFLGKIASLPYMNVLNSAMSNAWLIEQADIIRHKGIQRYMSENLSFTSPTNNFQAMLALSNYLGAIGYVQSSIALTNFLAAGAIRSSLGLGAGAQVQIGLRAAIFNPVTAGALIGSTLGMFLSGYLFGFGTGTVIGATVGGIIGAAAGAGIITLVLGSNPVGWLTGIVIMGISSFTGSSLGGWLGSLFNNTIDRGMDSVFGAINRITAIIKLLQILFSGTLQSGDMVTLTLALIPLLAALGKGSFNSANSDCTEEDDCAEHNIASFESQQKLNELELSYYNTKLLSEEFAWTPAMMQTAINTLENSGEELYANERTIYLALGGEAVESYYDETMIIVSIPLTVASDQGLLATSLSEQFNLVQASIKGSTNTASIN